LVKGKSLGQFRIYVRGGKTENCELLVGPSCSRRDLSRIHHHSSPRHKHFNQIELILKSALTKLDFYS
jgi:hypothetical protein